MSNGCIVQNGHARAKCVQKIFAPLSENHHPPGRSPAPAPGVRRVVIIGSLCYMVGLAATIIVVSILLEWRLPRHLQLVHWVLWCNYVLLPFLLIGEVLTEPINRLISVLQIDEDLAWATVILAAPAAAVLHLVALLWWHRRQGAARRLDPP